jgi:zinc transport system substrate-binding protein
MPNRALRRLHGGLAAALLLTGAVGCGNDTKPGEQARKVVAGFYPLQFITERVGGSHVSVTNLAQPGAEPHDLELKPSQITEIGSAELVVYLKGFQPELDKAIQGNAEKKSFDLTTITPLEGGDPHVWLDPARLASITEGLGQRLGEIDPVNAEDYAARAAELESELGKLDEEFAAGLKNCQRRQIITSHDAFGYLAKRYSLQQVPITGLTPESEPTPQHLQEVKQKAQATGATTIFFETLVSPKVAETMAKEVGAKTAVLDPIEGLEAGSREDYFSVMRSNLGQLREALGCS